MNKLFVFDLETTGIDPASHAIHQLSGMIVINDEVKTSFNYNIRPHEGAVINPKALEVSNVTEEQILAYEPQPAVFANLKALLDKYVDKFNKSDKFHLLGYNNAAFDNHFLRRLWDLNNDKYFGSYFWSDSLDVMVLSSFYLRSKRNTIPNFKLSTVASFFTTVENEKLHDASYDIELTYKIFKSLNEKLNGNNNKQSNPGIDHGSIIHESPAIFE